MHMRVLKPRNATYFQSVHWTTAAAGAAASCHSRQHSCRVLVVCRLPQHLGGCRVLRAVPSWVCGQAARQSDCAGMSKGLDHAARRLGEDACRHISTILKARHWQHTESQPAKLLRKQ